MSHKSIAFLFVRLPRYRASRPPPPRFASCPPAVGNGHRPTPPLSDASFAFLGRVFWAASLGRVFGPRFRPARPRRPLPPRHPLPSSLLAVFGRRFPLHRSPPHRSTPHRFPTCRPPQRLPCPPPFPPHPPIHFRTHAPLPSPALSASPLPFVSPRPPRKSVPPPNLSLPSPLNVSSLSVRGP